MSDVITEVLSSLLTGKAINELFTGRKHLLGMDWPYKKFNLSRERLNWPQYILPYWNDDDAVGPGLDVLIDVPAPD